jgi:hypothetical protein
VLSVSRFGFVTVTSSVRPRYRLQQRSLSTVASRRISVLSYPQLVASAAVAEDVVAVVKVVVRAAVAKAAAVVVADVVARVVVAKAADVQVSTSIVLQRAELQLNKQLTNSQVA